MTSTTSIAGSLATVSFKHPFGSNAPQDRSLGQKLENLATPTLLIDKSIFERNCERMKHRKDALGWEFRTHIKTHKTSEGTRIQCRYLGPRIICSTFPEIWAILSAGLVEDGTVNDVLYSLPVPANRLEDLVKIKAACEKHDATLRLMVDHPRQIELLAQTKTSSKKWSVFLKVDIQTKRAGLPPDSPAMLALIDAALSASSQVDVFGTYVHAGTSYNSRATSDAVEWLRKEIEGATACAKQFKHACKAKGIAAWNLRLAVGATPTAHVADEELQAFQERAAPLANDLDGVIELHAGNFSLLDAQQMGTNLVQPSDCALTVLATVVSVYPERKEALIDAGALALSKDTGPLAGYGRVIEPADLQGWIIGRTSQEHGILTHDGTPKRLPEIGEQVRVIPQHACLTAAQFPYFCVVNGLKVEEVWTPAKFWV